MSTAVQFEVSQETPAARYAFLSAVYKAARRNPVGAAAGILCIALIALAIVGPLVAPHSPDDTNFARLAAPNWSHPFGTDNLFRDMFSRIIVGTRNSLGIAFGSIAFSVSAGVVLGVTAGYIGGTWDQVVGRLTDAIIAYPGLVFIIFFLTIFPSSFASVSIAIGIILTPGIIRVVRSATIGVRGLQYIEAAVVVGNGPSRIMWRHVMPNVAAPIIVIATIQIGIAILIEAAISFLGLGVSSPHNPSWGRMLQETRQAWSLAWWTAVIPGLAIAVAVLAFNLFGDALRDALDPRLRGRQ